MILQSPLHLGKMLPSLPGCGGDWSGPPVPHRGCRGCNGTGGPRWCCGRGCRGGGSEAFAGFIRCWGCGLGSLFGFFLPWVVSFPPAPPADFQTASGGLSWKIKMQGLPQPPLKPSEDVRSRALPPAAIFHRFLPSGQIGWNWPGGV